MNEEQQPQEQKQKKEGGGLFGNMSATQKLLLIIFGVAIFFLVWTFIFGGIKNFYDLIAFAVCFIAIAVLFYMIAFFISWYMKPDLFSPKKDYFNRLVNLAIDLKPTNVGNLYFRGDKDKKRVKAGSIVGLIGIPYLIGKAKMHEQDLHGKDDYGKEIIIAKKGEPVLEYSTVLKKPIPKYEEIEYGNDGDTFFIYESGWFFLKKRHFLRCHKTLHGDLNGDVEVYDINPVPYGSLYEYPFKQLQREPERIMMQNQLEVILATSEHQLDLISQGVDSAVYFNPYFRLLHKQASESVSNG